MNNKSDIVREKKAEIRKEIIRRLQDHDPLLRGERSMKIQEELLSSEEFRTSRTVMTYVSLPTEVDTGYFNREALKLGKRVAVPYLAAEKGTIQASELTAIENMEKGPFGIYQTPKALVKVIPLEEIDLVIVPAIAYDKKNIRLGRGKGYYDQFLANTDLSLSKTIGIAFHFQVVGTLPCDIHDRPVIRVVTD